MRGRGLQGERAINLFSMLVGDTAQGSVRDSMTLMAHAMMAMASVLTAVAVAAAGIRMAGLDAVTGVFAGIAALAVTTIVHALIAIGRGLTDTAALRADLSRRIETLEKANAQLSEELAVSRDALRAAILRIDTLHEAEPARLQSVAPPAPAPARSTSAEAELLADLVDRIGRTLDARLSAYGLTAGDHAALSAGLQPPEESPIVRAVRDALEENRVELHLQPVVALPQRRTAFYEGFTRLRDHNGRLIQPAEFLPAADAAGMLSVIDNLLLFRCVQIVRRLTKQDRRIGIFCNLSSTSLSDEVFFPQFLDFMCENRDLAGSLIFEIGQQAFTDRSAAEARAMARLVDIGFRFSVDKVGRLDIDLNEYERSGVRFLKVEGKLLVASFLGGVRPFSNILREIEARDVSAVFSRHGVDLVAEKIEDEKTVIDVLELDTPFGQGKLFGPPRPIKDSLLDETAPPHDFLRRTA